MQLHLADWAGFTGAASPEMQRKIKRSIDNAYRGMFASERDWTCYVTNGRINTNAMYNTGTIQYTQSTRTVTLTGGTWPSYAGLCWLRVGPVDYRVDNGSLSGQTIRLSINMNPTVDLAAGTSYTLYQDMYPLPLNFKSMGTLKDCNYNRLLQYVPVNDMISSRIIYQTPTLPFRYALRTDLSYLGVSAIQFYPAPNQFYQYDYIGYRTPRPFTMPVPYTTGTVSTSANTVTGSGTAFTDKMVGCVIRFSNTSTAPTGMYGTNPFYAQRIITSFTNATTIGIDVVLDADQGSVAYEISDPIDMEATSMYTAFLRLCEFETAQLLNRDDVGRLQTQYQQALMRAMEADNRSFDNKPGGYRSQNRVSDYQPLTDATT